MSIDDNIDVQSAISCRSVGHVITKFSGMGRFIYQWCFAGALRARSSANILNFAVKPLPCGSWFNLSRDVIFMVDRSIGVGKLLSEAVLHT